MSGRNKGCKGTGRGGTKCYLKVSHDNIQDRNQVQLTLMEKIIWSVTTLRRKLKTHYWAILMSLKFERTFLPAGFADQNFSLSLQKTAESYDQRVLAPQKNLDCQSCPIKEMP
uniref:Uncharacterized protein n=1 Tax=Anser cygnoides TaxID=8845 RepID=A0A8B9DVU7_ANSCY